MNIEKDYAVYVTKSGKDALRIDRITSLHGVITFSYSGQYGAGSGRPFASMEDIVRSETKRHPTMSLESGTGFVAGSICS